MRRAVTTAGYNTERYVLEKKQIIFGEICVQSDIFCQNWTEILHIFPWNKQGHSENAKFG